MARNIYSRLQLAGTLVAQSPLHVGGCGDDVDTDLPLARDGAGQLYVPGTSLAGALRRWCELAFDKPEVDYEEGCQKTEQVWGYQDRRPDKVNLSQASFVVIDDAAIDNADQVIVEVRDGVGIDRQWGAAAEHIKYDRAILPRGTRMELNLTVDVAKREQRDEALTMIAALKQALERADIRLGAAKTRGLGCVRLEKCQLTEQVYGTRSGIIDLLRQPAGATVVLEELNQAVAVQPLSRLTVKIDWQPVGPLMVKAGFDGIGVDMLPLTSGVDGQVSLVLPGSSVKGAFRSQAERIVRTVLPDVQPEWLGEENAKKKFLNAVEVKLINELFGKRGEKDGADDNHSPLPGLGALGVMDCYGRQRMTQQQWQDIQAATKDADLRSALDAAGGETWAQAYHVAIDRWLGSAAESMLYTVLEPHRTEWEQLTLEVDVRRLPDDLHLPALNLLMLVLRDLARGRLPLGFATHRGMGTVQVERIEVTGENLPQKFPAFEKLELAKGRLTELPSSLREAMNQAWKLWIDPKHLEAAQ